MNKSRWNIEEVQKRTADEHLEMSVLNHSKLVLDAQLVPQV